jgi:tetratricopeptide (TPR) repeat protein
MTEELIDEQLLRRLEEAWNFKRDNKLHESMKVYLEILNSSTLQSSVIDKHLVMQNQCHRNLGDVFEQMEAYEHAKHHYTQALKLDADNAVAWTRLGFMHYEHFGDLGMAKDCFVAATKTMATLDKISNKICPILVKLAEIAFLNADFSECERITDAILNRQNNDKQTLIFALLVKHYLQQLAQRNDGSYLLRALQIDPNAHITGLPLFKKIK